MTLQASGIITAADINVELGRVSTAAFDINGVDERALAGIASGQISFSDFYGKSNTPPPAASLTDRSVGHTVLDPADATCYYRLATDGYVHGGASTSNSLELWRDEGSNPDFECRAVKVSGTTPVGTFNSWLDFSAHRTWSLGRSTLGFNECVIDFDIRNAATLAILTTARVTMRAEVLEPF